MALRQRSSSSAESQIARLAPAGSSALARAPHHTAAWLFVALYTSRQETRMWGRARRKCGLRLAGMPSLDESSARRPPASGSNAPPHSKRRKSYGRHEVEDVVAQPSPHRRAASPSDTTCRSPKAHAWRASERGRVKARHDATTDAAASSQSGTYACEKIVIWQDMVARDRRMAANSLSCPAPISLTGRSGVTSICRRCGQGQP